MELPDKPITTSSRKPLQERSRERVDRVLDMAEKLLAETGPEALSIPEVARASGVPRASIYQFFPNKYALLLAISDIHLGRVSRLVASLRDQFQGGSLEEIARRVTYATADYYNRHPVASMLILGGPMSRKAYLSQETTIEDIGQQLKVLLVDNTPALRLPDSPDVMTIAVEIAFACMKHSYYTHATITDEMADQAALAALAYLRMVL